MVLIPASTVKLRNIKEDEAAWALKQAVKELGGAVTAKSGIEFLVRYYGFKDKKQQYRVRDLAGLVSVSPGFQQPWIWQLQET